MSGITKKRIFELLNEAESILSDGRFVSEYRINEARVRIEVITDSLKQDLSKTKWTD